MSKSRNYKGKTSKSVSNKSLKELDDELDVEIPEEVITEIPEEIETIKEVEIPEEIETIKEVEIPEVVKVKRYEPVPKEERLFHVEVDKPGFNSLTGEKVSKPFIQKFTPKDWSQFKANCKNLGFTTKILWDPTKDSL